MLAKLTEVELDEVLYKLAFVINNCLRDSTGETLSGPLFAINQIADVCNEIRHVLEELDEKPVGFD